MGFIRNIYRIGEVWLVAGTKCAATILLIAFWLALPRIARGDAGVLIPRDKEAPDAAVLSLAEMKVDITIDNGDARIRITQIFANHTDHIEEGTYVFALPDRSTVSDFAVWDGPVRIPAVILERKRAEEVYDQARMQAIDPGLLQMGERDDSDSKRTARFSAKIVPIPAWGTKRLELEYHQKLTVNDWKQSAVWALCAVGAGAHGLYRASSDHGRLCAEATTCSSRKRADCGG